MASLHMICGLPGAGKTTLARELERDGGVVRLSPDEWMAAIGIAAYDEPTRGRIEALQWELALRLVDLGVDVALEAGFWSREERDRLRGLVADHGGDVILHYLDVPVEELEARIRRRNEDPDAVFFVDPDLIAGWAEEFEPPGEDELE